MKKQRKSKIRFYIASLLEALILFVLLAGNVYAAPEDGCREWWYAQCEAEGKTPVVPDGPVTIQEGKANSIMLDFTGQKQNAILQFAPEEAGAYVILARPVVIKYDGVYMKMDPRDLGSIVYPVIRVADEYGQRIDEPYAGEIKNDYFGAEWGVYASTPVPCYEGVNKFTLYGDVPQNYNNLFYEIWVVRVDMADIEMSSNGYDQRGLAIEADSSYIKQMAPDDPAIGENEIGYYIPLSFDRNNSYHYWPPLFEEILESFRWTTRYCLTLNGYDDLAEAGGIRDGQPFAALNFGFEDLTVDPAEPVTAYLDMDFGYIFRLQILDGNGTAIDLLNTDELETDENYTIHYSWDQTLPSGEEEINSRDVSFLINAPEVTITDSWFTLPDNSSYEVSTDASGMMTITVPHHVTGDWLVSSDLEIGCKVVSDSPLDRDENGDPVVFEECYNLERWMWYADIERLSDGFLPIYLYGDAGLTIRVVDDATEEVIEADERGAYPLAEKSSYTLTMTGGGEEKKAKIIVQTYYDPAVEKISFDKKDVTVKVGSGNVKLNCTLTPLDAEHQWITFFTSQDPEYERSMECVDGRASYYFQNPDVPGDYTVTCKTVDGDHTDTCTVHVVPKVVPESVVLDKTTMRLERYAEGSLKATVLPEDNDYPWVSWEIEDKSILVPNGDQTDTCPFFAQKEGTTTVTAITENGLKASCKVTVYDPDPWEPVIAAPTITAAQNVDGGTQLTWNAVKNAADYFIDCKEEPNGTWYGFDAVFVSKTSRIAPEPYLISGKKYSFRVSAVTADFIYSEPSKPVTVTYVAAPAISKIINTASGVRVDWGKERGAVKYRVFRREYNASTKKWGSWAKAGDTTAVSFTDKTAVSGKLYKYGVRCISSDGKTYTSGLKSAGKNITYVAAPVISSISNVSGGVKIAWPKTAGAAKYRIFRKTGSGSWTKLADTAAVNYTDKTAANGGTYSYTVRCLNSSGAYVSAYNTTGKTIVYLVRPAISSLTSPKTGQVLVKWNKNAKATGYLIQYSMSSTFASGNKSVNVTSAATVSKTIGSLTARKRYYVRVRAYKTVGGKNYYSAWSAAKNVATK